MVGVWWYKDSSPIKHKILKCFHSTRENSDSMLVFKRITAQNSLVIASFLVTRRGRFFVGQCHVIHEGCVAVGTSIETIDPFSTWQSHFGQLFGQFDSGFTLYFNFAVRFRLLLCAIVIQCVNCKCERFIISSTLTRKSSILSSYLICRHTQAPAGPDRSPDSSRSQMP